MNSEPINEEAILETLRQVIDPELDCNIVDLGLVYSIAIAGGKVRVVMTLTTPGCPMHESICQGVQNTLLNLDAVDDAEVELVWEPAWDPSMMSAAGRATTGVSI